MLWKYKKCYQETNEKVIVPPIEDCIFLNNVRGIYFGDTESNPTTTNVQYILAGDATNTVITASLYVGITPTEPYEELIVNESIKEGSLYVGGVNITTESPVSTPYWSITADFSECPH